MRDTQELPRRSILASAAVVGVGAGTTLVTAQTDLPVEIRQNAEDEYVTLINVGDEQIDLTGYKLNFEAGDNSSQDQIRELDGTVTIPAGDSIRVATGAREVSGDHISLVDPYDGEVLNNEEPDIVALLDPNNRVVVRSDQMRSADSSEQEEPEEAEAEEQEEDTDTMDATRFVHLAPDVGDIDIQVNGGGEWPTAQPFHKSEYESHTPGETYTVTVTPTEGSGSDPLIEKSVTLGEGAHTLALVGERCAVSNHPLDLVVIEDDYSAIAEDEARIQFIHGSTDAPALDILRKDGTQVANGVEFGTATTVDVPADGNDQVVLLTESGTTNQLSKVPITPTPGEAHTAFIVGYTDPESAPSSVAEPLPLTLGFDTTSAPTK